MYVYVKWVKFIHGSHKNTIVVIVLVFNCLMSMVKKNGHLLKIRLLLISSPYQKCLYMYLHVPALHTES